MNPYCKCGHYKHQHVDSMDKCQVIGCTCPGVSNNEIEYVEEPEESGLVSHARRELAILPESDEFESKIREGILEIVKIFSAQGHSGSSAEYVINMIDDLLRRRPLGPLTDDPDEWVHHSAEMWDGKNGVWQNKRDSRAFSTTQGVSYWLITETSGVRTSMASENGPRKKAHAEAEKLRLKAAKIEITAPPYDR